MKRNYTIDCDDPSTYGEMFREMPNVPASELEGARRLFWGHSIFYRRDRHRCTGVCSCCGKEMIATKELSGSGDLLEDLWEAKHNEQGNCPWCGTEVTYRAAGRFRDFSTLDGYNNFIFILPADGGKTVYFRCYTAFMHQTDDGAAHLCYVEKAHYRLSQGEFHMELRSFPIYDVYRFDTLAFYKNHYSYAQECGKWKTCKRPRDPWQGFMWNVMFYTFVNFEKLDETFLKYSQVKEFDKLRPRRGGQHWYSEGGEYGSTKLMAYLCYYAKYPSLEIAMKTGGREAARDLVYSHLKNARVVNWHARTPSEFWRLSKRDLRETAKHEDRLSFLRECKRYADRGLTLAQLSDIKTCSGGSIGTFFEVVDLLQSKRPLYVLSYCKNHSNQFISYYRDYLETARDIGRDLSVHNVAFPKDLPAAHDEAVAARAWIRQQKKQKEWEEAAREYKKKDDRRRLLYNYTDGMFMVRVAENGQEIVAEGNALHHCVGGYVERHLTCKTTILFLREMSAPDTPFYTIEMRDGKLQQVHGERNCAIHGDAKEFFDNWLLWVQAGGGLAKKKKQTTARTQVKERKAV